MTPGGVECSLGEVVSEFVCAAQEKAAVRLHFADDEGGKRIAAGGDIALDETFYLAVARKANAVPQILAT